MSNLLSLRHIAQVEKYYPEPKHTDAEIDAKTLELANESFEAQELWARFYGGDMSGDQYATASEALRDRLRGQAEDTLNEPQEHA